MQVLDRTGQTPPLPSTWLRRNVRLEYRDCYGDGLETRGTLLELCPAGPVLNIGGAKTLLAWDSLTMVELVEDCM
jgi:hypothetical protein